MRILVIGGTGFIGRHLLPLLLADGHDVAVVHRPTGTTAVPAGVTPIAADRRALGDAAPALRAFRPDVVLDMILSSGAQARAMMDLFRGAVARVVALSSIDVYRAVGVTYGTESGALEPLPLSEESAVRANRATYPPAQLAMLKQLFGWLDDEYDKIPVEREVLGDAQLPGTVLRLPMIHGPGDPLHRLWPLVKRMDDGRRAIPMQDGVAAWRSPRGYVENVAAAIALATTSERAAGRVYNVAEPDCLSEMEWAQRVGSVLAWTGEIVPLPPERTPPHLRMPVRLEQSWVVDGTRLRTELGYREPVPREEGIRRTVVWERAHPPAVPAALFDYAAEDAALAAG